MARETSVLCMVCGQAVPRAAARLSYDDPDRDYDEYVCENCDDEDFRNFEETEIFENYFSESTDDDDDIEFF